MNNKYTGYRADGYPVIKVNGIFLNPDASLIIRNHSPGGFEWGYGGSGPAQLALGILLWEFKDKEKALKHYQDFKGAKIASLPQEESWEITSEDIESFLKETADAQNNN